MRFAGRRSRAATPPASLGFDLVLDAVGAQATRAMAVESSAREAAWCASGWPPMTPRFLPHGGARADHDHGSYAYTMGDFEQALEWLADGRASLGELPPVLPLEEGRTLRAAGEGRRPTR